MDKPPKSKPPRLTGSAEEIAQGFYAYAQSGVTHVMIQAAPYSPAALKRLKESLNIYRQLEA